MNSPYVHERRRIMDPAKKVKFSQLVRESHSLEEAAEWLDVSIRAVQRERKRGVGKPTSRGDEMAAASISNCLANVC